MVATANSVGGEEARTDRRAYAIYRTTAKNGVITVEDAKAAAEHYGSGTAGGATDFAGFSASVHKPCTHCVSGGGDTLAFAARDTSGTLSPYRFQRRAVGANDVRLQIMYCGICHSDVHTIRSEWYSTEYPVVPGHEIVGVVTEVGSGVTKFAVGDRAAVGCLVDSCGECEECRQGLENYCARGPTGTYASAARDEAERGALTQGGYSTQVVVRQEFVLRFPDALDMAGGAPLLCAGITTYSPLRHFGLDKPGLRLGVVGLGGLGHMAVKFGKAFGCHVTVLSTSSGKREEAVTRLGADTFLLSNDADAMAAASSTLDAIIDTVAAQHDLAPYVDLLAVNGTMVLVGLPPKPLEVQAGSLARRRRSVAGSMIGGIAETQEMLDFCAQHNITCDIELVGVDHANKAIDRLVKNDVKYRFVLDIAGTLVGPDTQ